MTDKIIMIHLDIYANPEQAYGAGNESSFINQLAEMSKRGYKIAVYSDDKYTCIYRMPKILIDTEHNIPMFDEFLEGCDEDFLRKYIPINQERLLELRKKQRDEVKKCFEVEKNDIYYIDSNAEEVKNAREEGYNSIWYDPDNESISIASLQQIPQPLKIIKRKLSHHIALASIIIASPIVAILVAVFVLSSPPGWIASAFFAGLGIGVLLSKSLDMLINYIKERIIHHYKEKAKYEYSRDYINKDFCFKQGNLQASLKKEISLELFCILCLKFGIEPRIYTKKSGISFKNLLIGNNNDIDNVFHFMKKLYDDFLDFHASCGFKENDIYKKNDFSCYRIGVNIAINKLRIACGFLPKEQDKQFPNRHEFEMKKERWKGDAPTRSSNIDIQNLLIDQNKDPYRILDIDKKASDKNIRKNYRRLSLKFHPDKSKGTEGQFKECAIAHALLINKDLRVIVDSILNDGKKREGLTPF